MPAVHWREVGEKAGRVVHGDSFEDFMPSQRGTQL